MEDLESGLNKVDENFTRTLTAAASLIRNNFVHLEISFRTLYVEYRVERASVSLEGLVGEYSMYRVERASVSLEGFVGEYS